MFYMSYHKNYVNNTIILPRVRSIFAKVSKVKSIFLILVQPLWYNCRQLIYCQVIFHNLATFHGIFQFSIFHYWFKHTSTSQKIWLTIYVVRRCDVEKVLLKQFTVFRSFNQFLDYPKANFKPLTKNLPHSPNVFYRAVSNLTKGQQESRFRSTIRPTTSVGLENKQYSLSSVKLIAVWNASGLKRPSEISVFLWIFCEFFMTPY